MFILSESLKDKIMNKMNHKVVFGSLDQLVLSADCSCKGGCGTYVPPCGCCAYNS